MIRKAQKRNFPFIGWALILFAVLLVIYIPLKVHVTHSENRNSDEVSLSIFFTSNLDGYREPCG